MEETAAPRQAPRAALPTGRGRPVTARGERRLSPLPARIAAAAAVLGPVMSLAALAVGGVALYEVNTVLHQPPPPAASATPNDVRNALFAYPQMLIEAQQLMRARAEEAERQQSIPVVNTLRDDIFTGAPGVIGNPGGRTVVAFFFDYQCQECRQAYPYLVKATQADSDLLIVQREIPAIDQNSIEAILAAFAAQKQGLYAKVHDALLNAQLPLNDATIMAAAKSAGADVDKLRKDMQGEDVRNAVARNIDLAKRLNVNAAPSLVAPGIGVIKHFTPAIFEQVVGAEAKMAGLTPPVFGWIPPPAAPAAAPQQQAPAGSPAPAQAPAPAQGPAPTAAPR